MAGGKVHHCPRKGCSLARGHPRCVALRHVFRCEKCDEWVAFLSGGCAFHPWSEGFNSSSDPEAKACGGGIYAPRQPNHNRDNKNRLGDAPAGGYNQPQPKAIRFRSNPNMRNAARRNGQGKKGFFDTLRAMTERKKHG